MYLFVDQLTNVDFSYLDAERGLVGETWLANFGLRGSLDDSGMICDFGAVKSRFRHWLDEHLDHRLVVPTLSPNLEYRIDAGNIHLTWKAQSGDISLVSPVQGVAMVPVVSVSQSECAAWVVEQVNHLMPEQVEKVDLEFTTETITGSYYHYSHGLKKHSGNCQRIAHGHRSTIAIWRDGMRAPALEVHWSDLWRDIYIATREDLNSESDSHYQFRYRAAQGYFFLALPKSQCYLIQDDTTVENLAAHICNELKRCEPANSFRVKAFEGIGKGAIAEA